MHIFQALFAAMLLLQTTDASLIQLSRDRRSIKVLNIRLAGNGSTSSRGRVEVASSNGTWGTISQINFDSNDALVICRMLGFNTGRVITYQNAYFGFGSGPVWLNNLGCRGNETHLDQCQSDSSPYGHYYDAGVACGIGAVIQNVSLVGRRGKHEGTVQILGPDGMWGTLSYSIDGNAAKVICRTLGFETTGNVSVFYHDHFGQGSGPVYYSTQFGCTGREASITDCDTSDVIVNYITDHRYDVGVSCNKEHDVRLVGGNTELEGRVEVYHKGVWGTVCSNGFDSREAEVICYMLGYDTSSIQLYTNARYGSGTGQIWLNYLSCNGTESRLDECPSLTWGTSSCSHSQDVGIDCHQKVRLYGGRYPSEGYVQIGNDWTTICGMYADINLARVVCRSLGYNNTQYWNPTFYNLRSVTASNVAINCLRGTETNLAECTQGSNTYCSSSNGLYVNCTGKLNGRLMGGAHNMEGKLLIQNNMDSRWYRVCTDVWTDREATIFCQLISNNIKGNVYGRVIKDTAFDKQPGSFIFLSTRCSDGSQFCIFEVNNTESCPYSDIAMSCTHIEIDSQHSVRLVGGQAEYEGRIEINFSNQWHTLCDDAWDQQDASVVCRSLGYWVSSSTAYSNAWFGQGSVRSSTVDPYCNGNELSIFECQTGYTWGYSSCSHSDDAGVRCTSISLGRNKIRLAYGPDSSKGKLEVFYNNQWGGVCMNSWNQNNTDVVCRMMSYNSARPNYYAFHGTRMNILIGDIQCRGNESDIGLCKAFLDKSNCTKEVVGIDCSDGMQARLTGGNSSMGYAQLQENGSWKQICSSGWNNEEAAVFCRTLGFSVAVATTNVTLSNGVSASDYRSIDCSGWEDHINQCRLQNPPVNCGYATVNCLKCFYEYTNNTGTVVSPNYPSSYPPNWSCLYNIRPSRSSLYKLNFDRMGLGNEGDEVQVRNGFPGTTRLYTWKGHVDTPSNIGPIIANEFSILFHSDSSNEHPGFSAQWTPLVLDDALTAGCLSSGWNIKINTTILRMLYPSANAFEIYMSVRSCTGKVVDDGLQFLHSYSGCNTLTQVQMSSNEIIYTNQLIQPVTDPNFPFIVFNHMWRVETRCSVPLPDQNSSVGIHPVEGNAGSVIENGHHNLTSSSQGVNFEYHFYTDPAFYNEINNAYVPFGHELYVKVVYPSQNSNVKMKVNTCTVFDSTLPSHSFTLIKDGCPANAMVHLILTQQHETRFSYQVFEFQDSTHHDLTVTCNVAICAYNDNSHRCTQGCTTKRAMVISHESDPNATYHVESRTMIVKLDVPDAVLSSGTKDLRRDVEDSPPGTNHKP